MDAIHQKIAKRVFHRSPHLIADPSAWPHQCYGLAWNRRLLRWYVWDRMGLTHGEMIAYWPGAQRLFVMIRRNNPDFLFLAPTRNQKVVISNKKNTYGQVHIKHPSGDRWMPLENFDTVQALFECQRHWPDGPKFKVAV